MPDDLNDEQNLIIELALDIRIGRGEDPDEAEAAIVLAWHSDATVQNLI